jgi:hypothetical protein
VFWRSCSAGALACARAVVSQAEYPTDCPSVTQTLRCILMRRDVRWLDILLKNRTLFDASMELIIQVDDSGALSHFMKRIRQERTRSTLGYDSERQFFEKWFERTMQAERCNSTLLRLCADGSTKPHPLLHMEH